MGGPKALVRLHPDGPTLVEQAVRVLHDGGCSGVTVVVGAAGDEVAAVVDRLGWDHDVVSCPNWDEGMGASLRAGLTGLARSTHEGDGGIDAALVTLVDLPDVTADVVARVLAGATGLRATLRRAAYDGVPGHPALIGRDHWSPVVESAVGDQGARAHFRAHAHELVECGDLATGRDTDTPGDLLSPPATG
jgi:nicotine blue oxidoreductase